MSKKRTISILATLLFVIGLFVLVSYYVQLYLPQIRELIGTYPLLGSIIYLVLSFLSIVFAPFSSLPLMPVVANVWGPLLAGLLSLLSWTAGSLAAFWISQSYGQPIVKRFVSLEKIREVETVMPRRNIFWTILLLRMVFPVDLLSYALGLFTRVTMSTFFWATLLGMAPGAFILAYLGTVPIGFQVGFIIMVILVFFTVVSKKKPKWWRVLTGQDHQ